ncbi:hypothetical protein H9P43_008846 [Blastocladiella emersonii ATCC 22665]|nr:hypothetical protein H9P43_008846 [Blastocladiella emersonii ATCC 22665]
MLDAPSARRLDLALIAAAWYAVGLLVLAASVWAMVHRIRLPASLRRVSVAQWALIAFGFVSNTVQLLYQAFPDQDNGGATPSPAWVVADVLDYASYAALVNLYIFLALKRTQAALPPAWAHATNAWATLVAITAITVALVLAVTAHYAPSVLCASSTDATGRIKCALKYLAGAQAVYLVCDLLFAVSYIACWRRYTVLLRLPSPHFGLRARLVVCAFLVSAGIQGFLMANAFVVEFPFPAPRILWLAHNILVVATTAKLTYQLSLTLEAKRATMPVMVTAVDRSSSCAEEEEDIAAFYDDYFDVAHPDTTSVVAAYPASSAASSVTSLELDNAGDDAHLLLRYHHANRYHAKAAAAAAAVHPLPLPRRSTDTHVAARDSPVLAAPAALSLSLPLSPTSSMFPPHPIAPSPSPSLHAADPHEPGRTLYLPSSPRDHASAAMIAPPVLPVFRIPPPPSPVVARRQEDGGAGGRRASVASVALYIEPDALDEKGNGAGSRVGTRLP